MILNYSFSSLYSISFDSKSFLLYYPKVPDGKHASPEGNKPDEGFRKFLQMTSHEEACQLLTTTPGTEFAAIQSPSLARSGKSSSYRRLR